MKRVGVCACAFLFAGLCACSNQQQNQVRESAQSFGLAAQVQAKLAAVDADSAMAVHVAVQDGVATLTGEAKSAQERSAYESAAGSVSGVKRVVDRLTVNPSLRGPKESVADAALAAKVGAVIAGQAGVNVLHVKPAVRDGVVTLTGTVSSPSVKQTIVDAVRHTSGVKNVIDRIEVKS